MPSIKDITEPSKVYQQAKEMYHQNAVDYFDELIKKSETNVEANKVTCDHYYQKLKEIEAANKKSRKKGRLKTFLRVLEIICYILIVLIPVGILIHSKIKNSVDTAIKDANEKANKLTNEANELKNDAIKQTATLNSMYDWNVAASLVTKTIPLIETDQYLSNEKLQYLMSKYGYKEHDTNDISTIYVQSGSIVGNPFVIEQNYVQEMAPYIYTGTLIIHWTSYVRDSNGRSHPVTHTQTLVAHVTKPKPFYYLDTWLVYGNAAAPKLTFSRMPTNKKSMSDKDVERMSKKFAKKMDKISKKDHSFTQMANTKFESLFNALDRDNEVEFRLLFTPLAQSNMVDLIRMKEPYGDDFVFYKNHELNYIKTTHAQGFDYSSNPLKFIDFDVAKSREALINYCDAYFQSFYFDIAPLLSIPLYQNHKAREYIYKDNHKARYTSFEVESIANQYDKANFVHKESSTEPILKSSFVKREGDHDVMNITAHTFKAIPHVELVPTLGGDGRLHPVPVTWYEYRPLAKTTPLIVKDYKKSRHEFNQSQNVFANHGAKNVYYQKGLVSALINEANLKK